jgi:hypothetical protein
LFLDSLTEEQQTAEAAALKHSADEQNENDPSLGIRRCRSRNGFRLGRYILKAACITFLISMALLLLDKLVMKEMEKKGRYI